MSVTDVGFLENMTGMVVARDPLGDVALGSVVPTGLRFTVPLLEDSYGVLPNVRVRVLWDWVYAYYESHPSERTAGAASVLISVGTGLGVVDDGWFSSLVIDAASL